MTVRDGDSAVGLGSVGRKAAVFVLIASVTALATGPNGSFVESPSASAHTELESSSPADGDTVTDLVDEIALTFTEPVEPVADGFEVFLPNEEIIQVGPTTDDNMTFVLTFDPPLGNGEVGVRFEVISADGHPVSGAFAFTIADPTPEVTDPDPLEPDTTDSTDTTVAGTTTTPPTSQPAITTTPSTPAPVTSGPTTTELDEASDITIAAGTSVPTTEAEEADASEDDDSDSTIIVIVVILAAVAAVAAVVGGVIYARRRGAMPPTDSASGPNAASTEPPTGREHGSAPEPDPEP